MDQRSSFPGDILEALSCYLCCFLLLEGMGWIEGRTAMARVRETLGALLGLAGFLLVSVQGGSFAAFVWRGWDGGGQRQRRVAFVFPLI
jgi:hypothetical protein